MDRKKIIKVAVAGADGRMGSLITQLVKEAYDMELAGKAEVSNPLKNVIGSADVVIDFTTHDAAAANAQVALEHRKPIVIGTTGLTQKEENMLAKAAERIPIVYAPNMSIGVNLMWKLLEKTAQVLLPDYKVDIVEEHHVHKADRPSGTARKILDVILSKSNLDKNRDVLIYEENPPSEEAEKMVKLGSIRRGEIIGNHSVKFVGGGEEIEISHRAFDRRVFAYGALTAARWIVDKHPGLYSMFDVLAL